VQQADPFTVVESEAPQLGDGQVIEFVRQQYGLEVELKSLLSERDQNIRLRCSDGRQFVLKIANAAEDPVATDFQVQALLYLESYLGRHDYPITVPHILRTVDERTQSIVQSGGKQHVARVVTYLAGMPLGDAPRSQLLCRRIGACLAYLGLALRGFDHPGSDHGLLWDMQQALNLRRILSLIRDKELQRGAAQVLDDFEALALPQFGEMRSQVVHSDLNPDNLLIDSGKRDSVAGVIDFGDMIKAPLIADVAIGASYMRVTEGNPLAQIAEFLAAYHAVTPLEEREIDLLFDLIKTRLAASITILSWRASLRGADDPYLRGVAASEGGAAAFLKILLQLPREHAQQIFRQVCASQ